MDSEQWSPPFDGIRLGQMLIEELRRPVDEIGREPSPATDLLRWGADGVDDDTLWIATLVAVDLAADDDERWLLGDGLIDESIATRPALKARWREAYETNKCVRAAYRVMWDYCDGLGFDRGWWAL